MGHKVGHWCRRCSRLVSKQWLVRSDWRLLVSVLPNQQLLEKAVQQLVLVHRLHNLGAHCLHIIDGSWDRVGERCFATADPGGCEGDTGGFGGSQRVKEDLLHPGLGRECVGVGKDDRTGINVGRLEGGDSNHLKAGTGGEDVPEFRVAELDNWDLRGNGHHVGHCYEVRHIILRGLQLSVLIVIVIVAVIDHFAPVEAVYGRGGRAAKSAP